MAKLNQKLNLPVLIFREGKHFIAYSPALDLSTSGKDYEEVKRRFNEVAKIFFEEIILKGTFREVLKELGWKRINQRWQPPSLIAQEYVSINTRSLEKV
jgi:predicted RNase H-like HicB family nuclease